MALNWQPKSEMQRAVLESEATIVCAGGSAGTYKSETLLVDAVLEYDNPNFHGILFRESFPELSRGLIPRAHALYSQMGATYNAQDHSFHWPWGAVERFGYLGRDEDVPLGSVVFYVLGLFWLINTAYHGERLVHEFGVGSVVNP